MLLLLVQVRKAWPPGTWLPWGRRTYAVLQLQGDGSHSSRMPSWARGFLRHRLVKAHWCAAWLMRWISLAVTMEGLFSDYSYRFLALCCFCKPCPSDSVLFLCTHQLLFGTLVLFVFSSSFCLSPLPPSIPPLPIFLSVFVSCSLLFSLSIHTYNIYRHGNWPRISVGKKCPPQQIKRSAQIRM